MTEGLVAASEYNTRFQFTCVDEISDGLPAIFGRLHGYRLLWC